MRCKSVSCSTESCASIALIYALISICTNSSANVLFVSSHMHTCPTTRTNTYPCVPNTQHASEHPIVPTCPPSKDNIASVLTIVHSQRDTLVARTLTNILTYTFTHSLALTHSPTHSLTHSLTARTLTHVSVPVVYSTGESVLNRFFGSGRGGLGVPQ